MGGCGSRGCSGVLAASVAAVPLLAGPALNTHVRAGAAWCQFRTRARADRRAPRGAGEAQAGAGLEPAPTTGATGRPDELFAFASHFEVRSAVLLPALFGLLGTLGALFPVRNGEDPVGGNAQVNEKLLGG